MISNDPPSLLSHKLMIPFLILEFSLKIILFALAIKIENDYFASISFAETKAEFDYNITYLIVGVINLAFSFTVICKYAYERVLIFPTACVFILNLALDLVCEVFFFKFTYCHNYVSNSIIIARSVLAILFVISQYANLGICCVYLVSEQDWRYFTHIGLSILFALGVTSMLVLNAILLAGLGPSLSNQIGPYNIQMGFFNSTEVGLIKNGTFTKNLDFESRLVGRLGDAIYSSNQEFGYAHYRTVYYWHVYSFNIKCTNQSRLFYADCDPENTTSLTVSYRYLDDKSDYPSYKCQKNMNHNECASKCERLIAAKYELVLIQQFDGRVEPAWHGLKKCGDQPAIGLKRDDADIPCFISIFKFNSINFSGQVVR